MVKIVSFDASRLTARDGYIVQGISQSVKSSFFQQFLDELDKHPDAAIDLGIPIRVTNRMMVDFLEQLDRPPVTNGVKQIDPRGIETFLGLAGKRDAFGDTFQMANDRPTYLQGSKVKDTIIGGDSSDKLNSHGGNDFVNGRDGNDFILGGSGKDNLVGGEGSDTLIGGKGHDKLFGGPGSDLLVGGPGADAFFFTDIDFVDPGHTLDVIRDFNKAGGDQLVDLSGDLELIASGYIAAFNSKGSLIENSKTGDQVFVRDALLTESDIHDKFTPPPKGIGDGGDGGGGAPKTKHILPFNFDLVKITEWNTGSEKVELYQLKFNNLSDKIIANVGGLDISFRDSGALAGKIDQVSGATFENGKFSLPDSQGPIYPKQEIPVVTFAVHNRPGNLAINTDDFSTPGFTPRTETGAVVDGPLAGFRLSVKMFNGYDGGGVADVYIKNVGNTELDIKDAIFRLADPKVDDIKDVWGANEKRPEVFKIASFDGNPRADLHPGEYQKLFGFVYEYDDHRPKITGSDFHMLTSLESMFT